jgi:hypothetical protein
MVRQFDKRSKWWGWGREDEAYHVPDPDRFWTYVRDRLGETRSRQRVKSLGDFKLRRSRLPKPDIAELRQMSGEGTVTTDSEDRAFFSLGKGYKDLVWMRRGDIANPPKRVRTFCAQVVERLDEFAFDEKRLALNDLQITIVVALDGASLKGDIPTI